MYFAEENLKYDLIVHPNYSTKKIKINYSGQEDIYLKNGVRVVNKTCACARFSAAEAFFIFQKLSHDPTGFPTSFKCHGDAAACTGAFFIVKLDPMLYQHRATLYQIQALLKGPMLFNLFGRY